jgi:hypothetical protein
VPAAAAQVISATSHLDDYLKRYRARMRGHNVSYCEQAIFILRAMSRFLGDSASVSAEGLTASQFTTRCGLLSVNWFKLERYCSTSGIEAKVRTGARVQP